MPNRPDSVAGKVNTAGTLYLVVESVKPDTKHERLSSTPRLHLHISKEPQNLQDAYGVKPGLDGSFARQCLMACKLSEAGVRFVEIGQPGWDHHTNLHDGLVEQCRRVDQAPEPLRLPPPLNQLPRDVAKGEKFDMLLMFSSAFGRIIF